MLCALAAVCAVAVVLVGPPGAREVTETASIDTAAGTVGFADTDLYRLTPDEMNRELDLMTGLGVRTVRILIPWAGVEPAPGAFNWATVDTVIDAANTRGMGVLGVLNSTPGWAVAAGATTAASPPADPSAFGDFAAAVAGRYRGRVAAYEVWNEPNAARFWAPRPDPGGYAALLEAAYPRIKEADPATLVIGGALGTGATSGSLTTDPVTFLNGMYAAGVAGSFDAVSFHPYQFTRQFSEGRGVADAPLGQADRMHQAMADHGDGGKQIWATEYGEPTSMVDGPTQAAFIDDMLSTWRALPYAGPAFVYTTRDRNSAGSTAAETFGVYRTDWSPKPAAGVIADLAGRR